MNSRFTGVGKHATTSRRAARARAAKQMNKSSLRQHSPAILARLPHLPDGLPESEIQWALIAVARHYRWKAGHFLPAPTRDGGKWLTHMQGDKGVPDTLLAREGVVFLVEVKTATGHTTKEQDEWLGALGVHGTVCRPDTWSTVARILRTGVLHDSRT